MESSAIRAYKILERHSFSPEDAEEMAEIIVNSKDESLSKWVTSKEDLANVKEELRGDIAALDTKITSVRTELKEDIAGIREGMVRMEARLETGFTKAQNSTVWWFAGISVALLGIVLTMMKFMM